MLLHDKNWRYGAGSPRTAALILKDWYDLFFFHLTISQFPIIQIMNSWLYCTWGMGWRIYITLFWGPFSFPTILTYQCPWCKGCLLCRGAVGTLCLWELRCFAKCWSWLLTPKAFGVGKCWERKREQMETDRHPTAVSFPWETRLKISWKLEDWYFVVSAQSCLGSHSHSSKKPLGELRDLLFCELELKG